MGKVFEAQKWVQNLQTVLQTREKDEPLVAIEKKQGLKQKYPIIWI